MLTDHSLMSWWRFLPVALISLVTSCTEPNPRSCADGFCNDPAFPFCDADGSLSGTPNTCIAVACEAGAFEACRGDELVRCNSAGTDFDVVQCELGCDPASNGCVSCSSDEQCSNPAPVCDLAEGSCRGCTRDDECESTICDVETGSCVAEAAIVFASPLGSDSAACTLSDPCSAQRAATIAGESTLPVTFRLLPGTYTAPVLLTETKAAPLRVVATGATLVGGYEQRRDAKTIIRDLTVQTLSSTTPIRCDGTGFAGASLELQNVVVVADTSSTIISAACDVTISVGDLVTKGSGHIEVNGGKLTADRVNLRSSRVDGTVVNVGGRASEVRITNSRFENAGLIFSNADTTSPGAQAFLAYNTFVFDKADANGFEVNCLGSSGMRTVKFENNIIFSTTTAEPILGANDPRCSFVNNVIAPLASGLSGNTIANPRLVNAAGGDFRLQADSPAIDAAVPSTVALDPDHDFDGNPRPVGAKPDIGAFERGAAAN